MRKRRTSSGVGSLPMTSKRHGAETRYRHTEAKAPIAAETQLGEDSVIDVVMFGRRPPDEAGFGITEEEASRCHLPQVLRCDRGLAGPPLLYPSARSNHRDQLIVDAEARQMRDITAGAVAEVRRTRVAGRAGSSRMSCGGILPGVRAAGRRIIVGAFGDPAEEQLVLRIAGHQSLAAFVRHLPCGFVEKEAGRRVEQIQASAVELARQGENVEDRIVAA